MWRKVDGVQVPRVYYYDVHTRATSWTLPPGAIDVSQEPRDVKEILAEMNARRSDEVVQESGCLALINKFDEDESNIEIFFATACGIQMVLAAMEAHQHVENIQTRGCCILGELCDHRTERDQEFLVAGGIETVLKAMKTYPNNESLQCHGMFCLMLGLCTTEEEVAEAGGIEIVIGAMKTHQHESIQVQGCCILGGLADVTTKIKVAGGIETVIKAMKTYPNHGDLQANGMSWLTPLCTTDKDEIAEAGGIETMIQAMKMHSGVDAEARCECCGIPVWPSVLRLGCEALGKLVHRNTANGDKLIAGGGIEVLMAAMTWSIQCTRSGRVFEDFEGDDSMTWENERARIVTYVCFALRQLPRASIYVDPVVVEAAMAVYDNVSLPFVNLGDNAKALLFRVQNMRRWRMYAKALGIFMILHKNAVITANHPERKRERGEFDDI